MSTKSEKYNQNSSRKYDYLIIELPFDVFQINTQCKEYTLTLCPLARIIVSIENLVLK